MTSLSILNSTKIIPVMILLVTLSLVSSCGGGGDKGVPPNSQSGAVDTQASDSVDTRVSGVVMMGPVANATVSVYELRITTSGTEKSLVSTLLDSSTQLSNVDGEYTVVFKPTADKIAIAVCASNGTYVEPASTVMAVPVEKTFSPTDKLCAVTDISREQHKNITISYFSHLAYGLVAFKIKSGSALLDTLVAPDPTASDLGAIRSANKEVSEWLQLSSTDTINQAVVSIRPGNISVNSVPLTGNPVLTNEIKYGLANVAISELVEWLRLISPITQKSAPFNQVSTIELAQLMYIDLGDGVIDGFYKDGLFLSNTALSTHRLRFHFAFKLFMVTADTALNRTGLTNTDVNSFIHALNNTETFFPLGSLVQLDNSNPLFTHNFPEDGGVIDGDTKIRIDVTDISGIARVEMTISPALPGNNTIELPVNLATLTPTKPEWTINTVSEVTAATPGIPDGIYNFRFIATNNKGITATRTVSNVIISNQGIHAHIVNPPKVVNLKQARNPINSLAGFEAVINDIFYLESPTNSNIEFSIITTDPNFAPRIIPLRTVPFTEISPISRQYIATDPGVVGGVAENLPDGKYQLLVKAVSGKNIIPLLTATPAVVDFEYDTLAPTATFVTPDFSVFTTNSVTIQTAVTDPSNGINVYASGIQSQFITNAGTTIKIPVNDTQVIFNLGLPQWHVITLTSVDKAGNSTRSAPLNIAHDPTAPTVTINNSNIAGNWWSKLDITTTVTDSGSGIAMVDSTITSPNSGVVSTSVLDNSATPLTALKTYSFTETDFQATVADGVFSYQVQAMDFVTPPLHTTTAELTNIGIDTTAPTITINETVSANVVALPSNAWLDVTAYTALPNPLTQKPYITIDTKNRTGTVDWYTQAVVTEPGYTPRVGVLVGSDSGVTEIQVNGDAAITLAPVKTTTSPSIATTVPLAVNIYEITARATIQVEYDAIAVCVTPRKGSVVVNANNLCDATDGNGIVTRGQNPEYVWSEKRVSYPDAVEISNFTTVSTFESRGTLISVTARDAALKSTANGTVAGGNRTTLEACLNFQTQNAATEIIIPTGLTRDQIGTDSGSQRNAKSPTTGQNTSAPSTYACNEKNNGKVPSLAAAPVVPISDVNVNAAGNSNIVRCTIDGITNTGPSRSTPPVANQTFNIEMELAKSNGNSVCP